MMNENMGYFKFMKKQIIVINALNIATAPGYLLIGYLYTDILYEFIWVSIMMAIAGYGYVLYKKFNQDMSVIEKRTWAKNVKAFLFVYSIAWTFMFVYYISFDNIQMHYVTLATQLGASVVAATVLAAQKKLCRYTVVTLMLPIALYFLYIQDTFSYLLAFFTIVLCMVLLYAAKNTNDYITKSSYQAYHDSLTSLGNRRLFIEILEGTVKQNKNKYTYMLLIDLDYFKTINDTLGHDVGDALLREVSNRLKNISMKYNHTPARLGGDEFCILSESFNSKEDCSQSYEKFSTEILDEIKKEYIIDSNHLYISASIGVSSIHDVQVDATQFLKEADMAMYEAKQNGRDGIIVFNKELQDVVSKKMNIERLLYFALENNEISLAYQPQVNSSDAIIGCEVLARWNNKELGLIPTDVFIDIAEKTGYIVEIGTYILDQAFATLQSWKINNTILEQFSINISMRQLLHQNFVNLVEELLIKHDIQNLNTKIIFEITETSTSDDLESLVSIINKLKKYNIFFSIDDFGTGYSSLSYLRDIPLDELKIDRSFVSNLSDEKQASLIKTIIDISRNLDLKIVAEGVEEEYQKDFLSELNCDILQGYLFSKPVTKSEFENLCAT